ncbi:hypothetical protein [Streptomyces sp. NPDC001970]
MSVGDSSAARDDREGLHPAHALDDTVHQRVRLGILTIAREADRVEPGFLKSNWPSPTETSPGISRCWRIRA